MSGTSPPVSSSSSAASSSKSGSLASKFGSFMLDRSSSGEAPSANHSILQQKRGLAILFLMCMYAAIHYFIDYSIFGFQNNIVRSIMHAVFATIAINVLMSGNAEMQKGTVVAIWKVFIYAFILSIGVYSAAPTWLITNGGAEILLGALLFFSVGVFPNWYAKSFDIGIVRIFIFTAYLLPFIAQGLLFTALASSGLSAYIPQLQHILLNYLTPMFLPIWLYYFAFFQSYIEKPFWLVLVLIGLVLLFSSPLWIDYYNGGISALGTSGVNAEQKNAAVKYLADVGESAYTFARERTNATIVGVKCWYYDFSGQISSLSGPKAEDPKYAMCKKPELNTVSEFESSVERGSFSAASMSLSTITAAQNKYLAWQDAIFLSTFKAQSFDTKLSVNSECLFAPSSDTKNTVVFDSDNFEIDGSTQQDLVCTIAAGRLQPATSYELTSRVTFDYVTSAYITRYFTTPATLASFKSGSVSATDSLLSFYAVTDKQPISKSTKGPAQIGINAESGLIVVSNKNDPDPKEFTVVVAINNQNSWKGKIQELKSILLALPKGTSLKERSTIIAEPTPPKDGSPSIPKPTWSQFECSTGALTGNFQEITAEQCSSFSDPDVGQYSDLDCAHYNYYYLRPGFGTGKTAIAVASGLEASQKPFVSCQVVANDASALFAKNINFATKSIQARVKYKYQLEQKKSFGVEQKSASDPTYFADPVLKDKILCKTPNAYSLDPNLLRVFYQDGVRNKDSKYSKNLETVRAEVNRVLESSAPGELAALTYSDSNCFVSSIAMASIMNEWTQVQGNPMITNSRYGFLSANKKMIEYLQSKGNTIVPAPTDPVFTDATQLDSYLRANNILVATEYIGALSQTSDCKPATASVPDYACVAGKLHCGVGYVPRVYSQCSVSDCKLCEQTKATEVITLATQIAQTKGESPTAVLAEGLS